MTTHHFVNINTASAEELTTVPGIGPALAQRIINGRPYHSLRDLVHVSGIGETSMDELIPYLVLEAQEIQTVNLQIGTDEDFPTADDTPLETAETEIVPAEDKEIVSTELDEEEVLVPESEVLPAHEEIFYDLPDEEMAAPASAFEEVDVIEEKEPQPEPYMPGEKGFVMLDHESQAKSDVHTEKEPAMAEKKAQEKERGYVTSQQLTWSVIAAVVVSVLLTVALTLGILAFMNGDLRYATWRDANHLSAQITSLSERNDSLQSEADQMRKRMDAMEIVAGRVTALEESNQSLQDELTATQTQLEAAQKQISSILNDMTAFQQRFNDYNNSFLGIYNAILPLVDPMLEGGQNK